MTDAIGFGLSRIYAGAVSRTQYALQSETDFDMSRELCGVNLGHE